MSHISKPSLNHSLSHPFSNSNIYVGNVFHRRLSPKKHSFDYRLYMLALDVDDVENTEGGLGVFGFAWYKPLRFVEKDYLKSDSSKSSASQNHDVESLDLESNAIESHSAKDKTSKINFSDCDPQPLSVRIKNKVHGLAGHTDITRIVMLVQVRCFGIYFSPANFYFCYDKDDKCTQMLAEVSNTPWNERHYYLIDLLSESPDKTTKKMFQVSPFMDLAMTYYWQVTPPDNIDDKLLVKIENKRIDDDNKAVKLFDARLVMRKKPFSQRSLLRIWCQLPVMTIKVVLTIYWQAVKLFVKRVPFIGYQKPD